MSEVEDLLNYAWQLEQARVMDPRLLVEWAHWNEGLLRQAVYGHLTGYFFSDTLAGRSSKAIGTALDAALTIIVEVDEVTAVGRDERHAHP